MSPLNSPLMESTGRPPLSTARALLPALVLIGVIALLRIAYLAWLCPYTLIEDEAQYWVWAQMLDWSYYTKGPGVAWAIFATTSVFGDAEWAVRLPAVIAGGLGAVALAGLAWDMSRSRRVALLTAVAFHLVPSYLTLALLMTIDGPLVACWASGAWCAWRGVVQRRVAWLLGLGVVLGVGTLFKYTMLLMVPGLVAWIWIWRREVFRESVAKLVGGLATAALLMLLTMLPIIIWNSREGWPTIAHLLGHLGLKGGDMQATQGAGGGWRYNPEWTLIFVGSQLGLIGPVLVIGLRQAWSVVQGRSGFPQVADTGWHGGEGGSARDRRFGGDAVRAGQHLCVALSLPVLVFYLLVSFVAEPEGNWPIAGSVTLLPLVGLRVHEAYASSRRVAWKWTRFFWTFAVGLGLIVGMGMLRVDWFAKVPGVGGLVPVGRFSGATRMGQDAARWRDELAQRTGQEPFVIANHYGRAAQLWYYTPGLPDAAGERSPHTRTYCSSSLMPGGRTTPWDFWPALDLRRTTRLQGRPALAVGLSHWHWSQVFEHVEEVGALAGDHKRGRDGRPSRPAFLCEGFRGFPPGGVVDPLQPEVGGGR